MAASKKFRVPTAEEMELADKEASSTKPESLFKKNIDTKSYTYSNAPEKQDMDAVLNKNSTTKLKSVTSTNKSHPMDKSDGSEGIKRQEGATLQQSSKSAVTDGGSGQESVSTKTGSSSSLIVNTQQRGNPILKSVRNVPWEYGNIVPDYVMGLSNCALFLSLRYHQLHPNYIHDRLKQLGKSYELRVMLVQVDVKDPHHLLKDIAKICILADCTLVLAFSAEEAGRYLETYKIFENKPPEAIMEKTEENFMAKFTDCLTRVKSVNKTDCATLLSHFGNLSSVIEASKEDLSLCPGFGPQKANRLYDIFREPFVRNNKKRRLSGSSSHAAS